MGRGWLNLQGDQKSNKNVKKTNKNFFFGKNNSQQTSLCSGHAMPCFHAFKKKLGLATNWT